MEKKDEAVRVDILADVMYHVIETRYKAPKNILEEALSQKEPVDNYVKVLLEQAKKNYNLDINTENPTRGDRVKAAIAMRNESSGFYSLEIMVGRRVDSSEPLSILFFVLGQKLLEETDEDFLKTVYATFPNLYQAKK